MPDEGTELKPTDAPPRPDITALGRLLHGPRDVSTVSLVGIFLLGFVAFLYFAKPFLMPVILAVLLNFLLKPIARWLCRCGLPQWAAALLVLTVFLGALATGVTRITEPAKEWADKAPESVRKLESKVRDWLRRAEPFTKAAGKVQNLAQGTDELATRIELKSSNLADTVLSYTKSFLTGAIETIVLLYFLLASGDLFMHKLVKVLPTLHDKREAVEIAHEVQHNISTFLFTISVINAGLSALVAGAMFLIGLPNPVLWGVMAGLLNFIPYFGPFAGAVVLALAGLLSFESAGSALAPPLIYLGLHALEANFLTPLVLGRRLTLNPVVIFVSLIFWTWLWGIPGALLSVPVLMTLKIMCDHFRPLAPIGEFLSG
jgi:predicted PurR-regulated permease PerM